MRFAYADPPYLGHAAKFYGDLHPDAATYDDPETHRRLIERLDAEIAAEYDRLTAAAHADREATRDG